jgi:hypothetical protein
VGLNVVEYSQVIYVFATKKVGAKNG